MNTSLLFVGVATLFTAGTLLAQRPTEPGARRAPFNTEAYSKALLSPRVPIVPLKGDAPTTQGLTYTKLYYSDLYPSFETFNSNKVFLYEPGTQTVALVRNNRVFDETSGELVGGQVRLALSADNGVTYAQTEVYNKTGTIFAMPSFAISNPGNAATNPLELNWALYGFIFENTSSQWPRSGSGGIFKASGDPFDIPMEGPESNNSLGYTWNYGDMTSVSGDNPGAFYAGILGNTGGGQYGAYGTFGFDFTAEDFTTSSIPTTWDVSQFRNPNNVNSTYNGTSRIGADKDGALYMVVNSIYSDNDDLRIPAVSVSDDQGVTWSAFDRMPEAQLESYRTSYSWDNIQVYSPYDMEALVVTGTGKFSYFFRVGHIQDNSWANLDLVEAKYDNGTWTLSRVAELNGFPVSFTRQDDKSDELGQYAWVPAYEANPQGHEIEAALTADGQSILVKWIDDNPDLGYTVFTPAQPIYYYNNTQQAWVLDQIDSMLTTDVYISFRQVSSSSWSAKGNLTNDANYDHGTRIPPVIPNLQSVPFLSLKTITKSEYRTDYPYLTALKLLPDLILDASVDYRTPNMVQVAKFSTDPNSVSEIENYAFRFESVSPNPTSNEAQVVFAMDVAGDVRVEVFSAVGSNVSNVFTGKLDAGIHGMTVNTSDFTSGAYYVSLTVNGKRVAQPLSIVK